MSDKIIFVDCLETKSNEIVKGDLEYILAGGRSLLSFAYPRLKCAHCNKFGLEYTKATEPYSDEHFMCVECDSTYTIECLRKTFGGNSNGA